MGQAPIASRTSATVAAGFSTSTMISS